MRTIAPYLQFDNDPYIVLNEDGKLYWIVDAYTCYPGIILIQNRIRAATATTTSAMRSRLTCDAYTGEMRFYIADAEDPIIKTYAAIFPGCVSTPGGNACRT
ncbi:MAG: UPF0182 family protein [Syntrophomonadaceae bacterium]